MEKATKKMIHVVCAIIQKDNRYLLARRKQGQALAGYWEFPGGKVDPGETPDEALYRELQEELAIDTRIGAPLGNSFFQYNGRHYCLTGYRVHHLAGCFILDSHDDLAWVRADQLLSYRLAPADIPLAERLGGN